MPPPPDDLATHSDHSLSSQYLPPSPGHLTQSQGPPDSNSSNRQSNRQARGNRTQRQREARAASKLQRLYNANKKKCIRSILGQESPRCEIAADELINFFSTDTPPIPSMNCPSFVHSRSTNPNPNELSSTILPIEVSRQLKRAPNRSSPGPDSISYEVWKWCDVAPDLLACIYSICSLNQRVPKSWKLSNTILIYKKDDPLRPKNWRPISLQPTIM